jgi:hypothetical protein
MVTLDPSLIVSTCQLVPEHHSGLTAILLRCCPPSHPCAHYISCSAPLSRYGFVAIPAAPELDALLSAAETQAAL